jgi:hypothetical protein
MLKTIYFTPTITPKHHGNGHTTLKSTGSRPITEVKQRRARSVLGWVTAWEHRVPLPPNTFWFVFFF